MARSDGFPPGLNILVPLATLILVVTTLRYARDILVPLCLAILLTFILNPAVHWLENVGLRRIPAMIIISALFVGATAGLAWMVGRQLMSVAANLPQYRDNIARKFESLPFVENGRLKSVAEAIRDIQNGLPNPGEAEAKAESASPGPSRNSRPRAQRTPVIVESPENSRPTITAILGPVLGPVSKAGIVLVLVVFMLANRESLRNRIFQLVGQGHLSATTRAFDDAAERVSRYLVLQSLVNLTFGLTVGLGLYVIGIPNPILWGVLSGVLRYLPYIGPIVGGAFPTLFALSAFPGWHRALLVFCLYLSLEILTAYFVEPALYGSHTLIAPMAILVAAIFWGVLWGPVGLVLSTPLTVCLVAFGKHIPKLDFLTVLLGEEIQLSPEVQVYQRLLADDPEEVRDIVKSYLEQNSTADLYDNLLLPALILAEQDLDRNALDESRRSLVFENLREMIEDFSIEPQQTVPGGNTLGSVSTNTEQGARILAVPARDEGDEIAAMMLSHLLKQGHYRTDSIAPLPIKEMVREISVRAPEIVCISALSPLSVRPARTLYRRVKNEVPRARVVVGTWKLDERELANRAGIQLSESDKIVSSLADGAYQIQAMYDCPA